MSPEVRRLLRWLVTTALLVLAGGLLWYSGTIKGDPVEPSLVDSAVEQLIPAPGAPSALRRSEVGIDLGPGWEADLIVAGVVIPPDQVRRNPPLNQVFFRPGEGKELEALPAGEVTVTAIIWRPVDGQTRDEGSRRVTWRFRAG
jgi:hypothetical protein